MPYTPTTWVEGVTTLGPTNMNKIEAALAAAPGTELAYAVNTGPASVTATTEATANLILAAPAVTFDGVTVVLVEFFAPMVGTSVADTVNFVLFDGGSSIGYFGSASLASGTFYVGPVNGSRRLTPSAASHTYSMRAFVSGSTGTIYAGAGGVGNYLPAFIRLVRVS